MVLTLNLLELAISVIGPQSGRHYLVFQQLLCNYVIITTITINFPACYYESRCIFDFYFSCSKERHKNQ